MIVLQSVFVQNLAGNLIVLLKYRIYKISKGDRMKKGKFYKKLFVTYILVVIIYTLFVVGLFYYKNNEINEYQVNNSNRLLLEQFKNRIDSGFNTAFKLVEQLRLTKDIIHYARSGEIDYYYTTKIFNILNDLNVFYEDSGFRIAISRLNINEPVITPERTMDLKRFAQSLNLQSIKKEEINSRLSLLEKNFRTLDYIILENNMDTSDIITFVKRKQFSNNSYIYFFVSFNKSEIFSKQYTINNNRFAIICNNEILSGNFINDQKITKQIVNQVNLSDKWAEEYNRIKLKNYVIHTIGSNVLRDFHYIFVTTTGISPFAFNDLFINSLLFLILFLFVGTLITFLLTGYLYRPIFNIVNSFKNVANDSNDELLFIKESVSKIRQANISLENVIKNNKTSLKIKFLRELLYGLITEGNVKKYIEKYNLNFFNHDIIVSILEFVDYQELKDTFEKKYLLEVIEQTLIIIKEQLKKEFIFELVELSSKKFTIIAGIGNVEKTKNILNKILSDIETSFEIKIIAAVGKNVNSIFTIEESFQDAITVLENRNITSKKLTIAIEDIHPVDQKSYFYPLEFERKLIDFMVKGKSEEMITILKQILKRNLDDREIAGKQLDYFILTLANTIERIFQKINIDDRDIRKKENAIYEELEDIEKKQKSEIFKVRIIDIFKKISLLIETETEISECTFTEQLIDFIHDNYDQDLTLQDLAERFNYSTGYIGKLFKENVRENFKDYLNKYRVKEAKKILKSGKNIKIKDVSEMVGCNHINTFIRIFKKYEGISPGQYNE